MLQGSQARKIHEALPTFWDLLDKYGKVRVGQTGLCNPETCTQHLSFQRTSRVPQKQNRLFHPLQTVSSNSEVGRLFQTGHQAAPQQSQQFRPEVSITFLQKTFKGGNSAITMNQCLFTECESVVFSVQLFLILPKGKAFGHQPLVKQ